MALVRQIKITIFLSLADISAYRGREGMVSYFSVYKQSVTTAIKIAISYIIKNYYRSSRL